MPIDRREFKWNRQVLEQEEADSFAFNTENESQARLAVDILCRKGFSSWRNGTMVYHPREVPYCTIAFVLSQLDIR
jgi:hypothetical protein